MTNLTAPMHASEQAEAVLHVFQSAPHPLTVPQAEKLYNGPKLKKNDLRQIVECDLLMKGQLFRCSSAGSKPRYWVHDEEERIRETIEDVLKQSPLVESKLVSSVNKALPKVSSPAVIKNRIETLRQEGRLHERPGKGRRMVLSLERYDPLSALTLPKTALKGLSIALAKVQALGGGVEELLQLVRRQLQRHADQSSPPTTPEEPPTHQSTPANEIDELILKGMRDLDSSVDQGASILLRDLRRNMPTEYRSHETFDRAILRLAEQDSIVLHRHDQPSFLTDTEREELVRDENGTYYTAIAQRI